jgi:CBS domain-containing protein
MNIGEVMTRQVRTCRITDSLNDAARIMWETDCGAVPIVDADDRVVAMLTDRDICMAAYTQGKALSEINVTIAASKRLVAAAADDSLHRAEELMRDGQVRRLPVLDADGRAIGILSITDLARHAPELGGGIAAHLVGTMAGICRQKSPAPSTLEPRPAAA